MGQNTADEVNSYLHDDVRARVEAIEKDQCSEWGGRWQDDQCQVNQVLDDDAHTTRTVVRSPSDGVDAFERYTDYFDHVLSNCEWESDSAVLLPCGKRKPIGSSAIHQKKATALKRAGFYPDCDIIIISEPCTVIPHDMRLSLPAVNYDFPPEFAEETNAPEVFEIFTDRLATWIDESGYDTLYPYLVERHQQKLDTAMTKAESDPDVVEIPGASLSLESKKYSGDLFKSVDDITAKLEFVKELKDPSATERLPNYEDDIISFYEDREEYSAPASV